MKNADTYVEKSVLLDISKGDQPAFRRLYDVHQRKVYYISMRLLKSETQAEDVVQEVFSKVWLNREKLPVIDNFPSWLNAIVRNHIYNYLRKKANEESFIFEALRREKVLEEDGDLDVNMQQLTGWLYQAIEQLPLQQKRVLQMSRLQGKKHREIAEELKISQETVKKHIMQAMINIRQILKSRQASHLFFYCMALLLSGRL